MRTSLLPIFKYPLVISLLFLIITTVSSSQEKEPLYTQHKETVDDRNTTVAKTSVLTSPAFVYKDDMVFVTQVNVDNIGRNLMNDAANEPSIAFDYTNPNNIAIGWRQFDNILNNFRQAGNAYTIDGGLIWNYHKPIDSGVFRSDPVLDSDAQGNFYYNSLTVEEDVNYVCDVYKSFDGGATWGEAVDAQGGDKQWMVIDKVSEIGKGNIYAYWTSHYSICSPNSFTRSVNGGKTFEECTYIPEEPYWGTLAVAKNGDLFIAGYSGSNYIVVKSTSAKYADSVVTFKKPVTVKMNGALAGFGGPNPGGITGQTYIAADTSTGPYSGYIYVLGTVATNDNDPSNIMVAASTDAGKTWLPAVRVNDDTTNTAWQWFGTMSVAPNGRVDVVWLDTRNAPEGTFYSELFYSFSFDGGQTWYPNINLLEQNFDPHVGWPQQNKMGDYFDMVSDNEGVHLAWAATFNGEQDVYYARILTDKINSVENNTSEIPTEFALEQNYPNPFNPSTTIKFSILHSQFSSLKVYDTIGREVETLLSKNLQPGTYEVNFDAGNLSSGVYFYKLTTDEFTKIKKMMLLK